MLPLAPLFVSGTGQQEPPALLYQNRDDPINPNQYAGLFRSVQEAQSSKDWIAGGGIKGEIERFRDPITKGIIPAGKYNYSYNYSYNYMYMCKYLDTHCGCDSNPFYGCSSRDPSSSKSKQAKTNLFSVLLYSILVYSCLVLFSFFLHPHVPNHPHALHLYLYKVCLKK